MEQSLKIISGGQTGVDQAALRAAQAAGLDCGGWCPPGRTCEAGTIPPQFPLQETPEERSADAPEIPRSLRTEWNVRDSDATLVLQPKQVKRDAGTEWTEHCAAKRGQPLLAVDPWDPQAGKRIHAWLAKVSVKTLNVAGPSEGNAPGVGKVAYDLLLTVFVGLGSPPPGCEEAMGQ